jgi:hypothetical protein
VRILKRLAATIVGAAMFGPGGCQRARPLPSIPQLERVGSATKAYSACYVALHRGPTIKHRMRPKSLRKLWGRATPNSRSGRMRQTNGQERPCSIRPRRRSSPSVLRRSVEPAVESGHWRIVVARPPPKAGTQAFYERLAFNDKTPGFRLASRSLSSGRPSAGPGGARRRGRAEEGNAALRSR